MGRHRPCPVWSIELRARHAQMLVEDLRSNRRARRRCRGTRSVPRTIRSTSSATDSASSRFCSTSRIAWPRCAQALHDLLHLQHQARRKALGRLVHQDQLGIGHQGAADRQHLLLAAAQRAARMIDALGELGEFPQHLGEIPAGDGSVACGPRGARPRERASMLIGSIRFSRTLSERKMRRPCGTMAMPCLGDRVGRLAGAASGRETRSRPSAAA